MAEETIVSVQMSVHKGGSVSLQVTSRARDGSQWPIRTWHLLTGRPSGSELSEISSATAEELETWLLCRLGCQEELEL